MRTSSGSATGQPMPTLPTRPKNKEQDTVSMAMLTAQVAALAAGVRREAIYQWLRSGYLVGRRAGTHGRWRISRESLLGIGVSEDEIKDAEKAVRLSRKQQRKSK